MLAHVNNQPRAVSAMKTGKRFANSNKPPGWPDPVPRAGQGTGVPELGHTADGGDGDGGAGLAVVPSAMMLLAPQPWLGYLGPPVNPPPPAPVVSPHSGVSGPLGLAQGEGDTVPFDPGGLSHRAACFGKLRHRAELQCTFPVLVGVPAATPPPPPPP